MHILNEDLKKMMYENENLQNKNKNCYITINKQKEEIERLKKNSQLNFKMIKEDNVITFGARFLGIYSTNLFRHGEIK